MKKTAPNVRYFRATHTHTHTQESHLHGAPCWWPKLSLPGSEGSIGLWHFPSDTDSFDLPWLPEAHGVLKPGCLLSPASISLVFNRHRGARERRPDEEAVEAFSKAWHGTPKAVLIACYLQTTFQLHSQGATHLCCDRVASEIQQKCIIGSIAL